MGISGALRSSEESYAFSANKPRPEIKADAEVGSLGSGQRPGLLVLEGGEEGGGDDGDFVAAQGAEVEQVFAALDAAEHRRSVEAHPAGEFVHVHGPGLNCDHARLKALGRE